MKPPLSHSRLVALLVWLGCVAACWADVQSDFADANKFYQQGKFSDAAKIYHGLLQAQVVSPEIWFNLGNAELKAGHAGRAIAAYRQAALLSPRDVDLSANLQYSRSLVNESVTLRPGRLAQAFAFLTSSEWGTLAGIAVGVLFILAALREWRPDFRNILGAPIKLAVLAAVLFLGGKLAYWNLNGQPAAVIVQNEAAVRAGPLEDAQTLFSLKDGVELAVTDTREGWLQVHDAQHRVGWLKRDTAQVVGPSIRTF